MRNNLILRKIRAGLLGVSSKNKNKSQSEIEKLVKKDRVLWENYAKRAKKGAKILIATSTGGHKAVTPIESLLAVALTLRGARVHFLLCDKLLPACLQATTTSFKTEDELPKYGPQKSLCNNCLANGEFCYKSLGLPIHYYSQLISKKQQEKINKLAKKIKFEKIPKYQKNGIDIGEHSLAGALRYFAKASLENEKHGEKVLRRYFQAALLTSYVIKKLLIKENYRSIVFHHGIYIPQGIIGEVARSLDIPIVNWNPAYRKKCFIFSHKDTYHHTLMLESVSKWKNLRLTKKHEETLLDYLSSRIKGTKDWIWFHEKPESSLKKISQELGINFKKPTIGLLTNVMWDAQLHYPRNVFPSMLDWLEKTIAYFSKRRDLQLVIRVHPAEIRGTLPSRQKVVLEVKKIFPKLPKNIFVIPPESNVSTYSVMYQCDSVIIYGTKTGVELTSMGIPVIVAGEAWIRGKELTYDARSQKHYFDLLDKLPFFKKMSPEKIKKARRYAYHFFFRRMIPIKAVEPTRSWPPYKIQVSHLKELEKNKDLGLDTICDGILKRKDFIYPAEEVNILKR